MLVTWKTLFFFRTASIIDQKKAEAEDIDGMMRRIDDVFAREKRKAATGKTDADFAKLPLLMKFEERARYVRLISSKRIALRMYCAFHCIKIFVPFTTSTRAVMDKAASGQEGRERNSDSGEGGDDDDDSCSIMSTSVISTLDPITRKPMRDPGRGLMRSCLAKTNQ